MPIIISGGFLIRRRRYCLILIGFLTSHQVESQFDKHADFVVGEEEDEGEDDDHAEYYTDRVKGRERVIRGGLSMDCVDVTLGLKEGVVVQIFNNEVSDIE